MKTVYVLGNKHTANFLLHRTFGKNFQRVVGLGINDLPNSTYPVPGLLLFTGGQDLCPSMYGETYSYIQCSSLRDEWEKSWFLWAVEHKVPMFGICRGMQLLTALTGGTLIPHVNNHVGGHLVKVVANDTWKYTVFPVNSLHHQMCIPTKEQKVLAYAENIAFKQTNTVIEPEAIFFPKINSLGVQWHPEMMNFSEKRFRLALDFVDYAIKEYIHV